MSLDLDSYISRCRFCLSEQNAECDFKEIDKNVENVFYDLTKLRLKSSEALSSLICRICGSEYDRIEKFKSQLIRNQVFLENLVDSFPKTQKDATSEENLKLEAFDCKFENEFEISQIEDRSVFIESSDVLSSEEKYPDVKTRHKRTDFKRKRNTTKEDFPDKTCPICKKTFTEKRKIPLHIRRIHVKIKDFHCDHCDYSAHTKFDIVRHVKNIHMPVPENPTDLRICPHCAKVVRGNNQLTLHIRKKHLNIKKFLCDMCSFASYGKYEIRSHLQHMHIPKEFKECHPCGLCDSILSSSMGLKVHMQHRHSGVRPHKCFCGKAFSLKETLKTHIRNVHKGERRYPCPSCPKRFNQSVRLRDHINNNHGTKQEIPCTFDNCGKVFGSTRNLKAHLIYHSEPKYACNNCDKKFYLSNKLKEHTKIHEGLEHPCLYCSRSFQLGSSLKRHMKIHVKSELDDQFVDMTV